MAQSRLGDELYAALSRAAQGEDPGPLMGPLAQAAGGAQALLDKIASCCGYAGFPKGAAPALRWLLENGADANAPPAQPGQESALWHSCWSQDAQLAALFLEFGADLQWKDISGWTPLMCAAMENEGAMCALLLDAGADLGARDEDGMSALDHAAQSAAGDAAAVLVRAGADPLAPGGRGLSPLEHVFAGTRPDEEEPGAAACAAQLLELCGWDSRCAEEWLASGPPRAPGWDLGEQGDPWASKPGLRSVLEQSLLSRCAKAGRGKPSMKL